MRARWATRASGFATRWTRRWRSWAPRLALHIGHNASVQTVGDYTYLVDAKDDIKFDTVVQKSIPMLSKYKRIGLATFSQHLDELGPVKRQFEDAGFEVHLGRKNNLLLGEPDLRVRLFDGLREHREGRRLLLSRAERVPRGGRRARHGEAHVPPRPVHGGDARHEGGGRGEAEEGDTCGLQGARREGLRGCHRPEGGPDDGAGARSG